MLIMDTGDQLLLKVGEEESNVSILSLRGEYPALFYPQDWYLDEEFAATTLVADREYRISRRTRIDMSVPPPQDPPAVVAVAFEVAHFLWTGEFIWHQSYVWCSDKDSEGDKVYVGGGEKGRTSGI